jgi:hypothetical protein
LIIFRRCSSFFFVDLDDLGGNTRMEFQPIFCFEKKNKNINTLIISFLSPLLIILFVIPHPQSPPNHEKTPTKTAESETIE